MVPVTLPPDAYDWAEEIAQTWIDWAKGSGVDVVGDLEELRPVRPAGRRGVARPRPAPAARRHLRRLDALVALTLEAARRPDPDDNARRSRGRQARAAPASMTAGR